MLLIYLYGEGLVSYKNLFPIQLYIYIDNAIIIKNKVTKYTIWTICNHGIQKSHWDIDVTWQDINILLIYV